MDIPIYQLPLDEAEFSICNLDFLAEEETLPHRQNYYEILLFENGSGHLSVDFSSRALQPKSISLIMPNHVHQLQIEKSRGLLLKFSEDTIAPLAIDPFRLREIDSPLLPPDRFVELYVLALNIKQHSDDASPVNRQIALHYLSILLLKLVSAHSENLQLNKDEEDIIFNRFVAEVEKNFATNRTTKLYEDATEANYKKLNSIIKKRTGKTVLQVLHDRLLLEIKRMLAHGSLSYKEIAHQLNFDSTASFNTFVKREAGVTPNELKQKLAVL